MTKLTIEELTLYRRIYAEYHPSIWSAFRHGADYHVRIPTRPKGPPTAAPSVPLEGEMTFRVLTFRYNEKQHGWNVSCNDEVIAIGVKHELPKELKP